jgi:MFS family permease
MPQLSDRIARTAWLLLATRAIRSLWQGALVVDFALYLKALDWGATAISAVLAAALLVGAALSLVIGPLSDRFGRRRFLLCYDALQGVAAAACWLTASPVPLAIAAVIGGFGRGGNGNAGPFAPVEQAWLAYCVPTARRGGFYSLNSAVGFAGMAAGAVIAAIPGWIHGVHPAPAAFRPLFALTAALSVVTFALVFAGRDVAGAAPAAAPDADEPATRRRENSLLARLVLANTLNGAGIGLVGPLLAYWFAIRFHRGPAAIGPMMAAGFVMAAGSSLLAGLLTRRFGIVRTIVWVRAAGLALLIALPFSPSFAVAGALYIGRTVLTRATIGARAAVSVGIVRAERRGLSSSLANVALQIPRALGPIAAGLFFESGLLAAPFLVAAVFQGAYIWVYQRSFGDVPLD